ncbi:hypothetical protein QYF36_013847 [Acer negundo]|nr:hypothetical protein QYF36_013847 [Acer negundo]
MKQGEEITYGKGEGKDLIKMSTSKAPETIAPRRAQHWRRYRLGCASQNSLSYIIGDGVAWAYVTPVTMSLRCTI